jgi:hypothetical protein
VIWGLAWKLDPTTFERKLGSGCLARTNSVGSSCQARLSSFWYTKQKKQRLQMLQCRPQCKHSMSTVQWIYVHSICIVFFPCI